MCGIILLHSIPVRNFYTTTLQNHPRGRDIVRIMNACIEAVEPGNAVRRFVKLEKNLLHIDHETYHLDEFERVNVLGLGKATEAMSLALLDVLTPHPSRGLLIPKVAFDSPASGFTVSPGGHPVPTEASLLAGNAATNCHWHSGLPKLNYARYCHSHAHKIDPIQS